MRVQQASKDIHLIGNAYTGIHSVTVALSAHPTKSQA